MTFLFILWASMSPFLQETEPAKTTPLLVSSTHHISLTAPIDVNEQAYRILELKCNTCHSRRNRRRVFTRSNMDGWSDLVYDQVFVKKRMPKKSGVPLTSNESRILRTWIDSLEK